MPKIRIDPSKIVKPKPTMKDYVVNKVAIEGYARCPKCGTLTSRPMLPKPTRKQKADWTHSGYPIKCGSCSNVFRIHWKRVGGWSECLYYRFNPMEMEI